MKQIAVALLAVPLLTTLAAAQPASLDDAMKQAEQYQRQYGGAPPKSATAPAMVMGQPDQLPDPVELTKTELTSFIDAVNGLKKLGVETQTKKAGTEAGNMVQAYATNAQALSILTSNGFTPERFQQVAYTVGMAMAALEMKGKGAEIDAARAQQEQAMAQMKSQMSPEQYELMRKQLGHANTTLDQMKNQPAGNVELVGEHRKEIDAALED